MFLLLLQVPHSKNLTCAITKGHCVSVHKHSLLRIKLTGADGTGCTSLCVVYAISGLLKTCLPICPPWHEEALCVPLQEGFIRHNCRVRIINMFPLECRRTRYDDDELIVDVVIFP